MTDEKKVQLPKTGQIELPSADVTEYIGKKAIVKTVEEMEGEHGYYVKVTTEDLGPLKDVNGKVMINKDKEELQARGSRIFSLKEDKDENIGWTKESILQEFLDKHKVKHYNDLIGVEVVVQGSDKRGKTFLTII